MGIFVMLVIILILYCAIQKGKEEAAIQRRIKQIKRDTQKYEQIKKDLSLLNTRKH